MKKNWYKELLPDQTLGEKLIKKWFWLYLFSFLVAPAGYIIKIIISNSVSVADVWVLFTIVSLVTLLSVYNDLWLTESLQYFIPRYWIKKEYNHIKTSIYLSLSAQIITGLIIACILWFGAPWLAVHYFQSPSAEVILKYFCFYFLGINLFQVLQSIFYAFQNTLAQQFVEFVRMWSIVGFTLFFFLTGRQSIQWYSLNWILGLIVGIVVGLIIFFSRYKKSLLQWKFVIEKPMLKEYLNYAFWCFLGLNTAHIFGQVIQQLIIVILGPESAGYYTNFLSLFGIASIVIWPIILLVFPMVSEFISKKNFDKLKLLFSFFYTYFVVFAFLFAVFLMALWPELALILFGQKFILSGELMILGGFFTMFSIFVGFNFSVMAGMWKIKDRVKILFYSILLVTALSILWMFTIWIYGAVIALWLAYLFLFVLSFRLIYKDIKFKIDWNFVIRNLIIISILAIITWMIKDKIFVFDDLLRLKNLWKILGLAGIVAVLFLWFNGKRVLMLKDELIKMKK